MKKQYDYMHRSFQSTTMFCGMSRENPVEQSLQYQKAVKCIIYSVTPLKEMGFEPSNQVEKI
jgi:hypothetical protein